MATVKDVRVRIRANIILDELRDQGDADRRPGREGTQKKYIEDVPAFELPLSEFNTRLSDAMKCMEYGYRVDPDGVPPEVITEDATLITRTTVRLNGLVTSHSVSTSCGFVYGTDKTLGIGSTVATGSPANQATVKAVYVALAGLTANTKYYYRVYAQKNVINNTQYGIVKSFITLPNPT